MGHARQSRFPRTNALRRRTSWAVGPNGSTSTVSAASTVLFPTFAQANLDGLTLVRTRGDLMFYITGAAIRDQFTVGFGICVVNENAANLGVTAIPEPITDQQWDGWLSYWSGMVAVDDATNGTILRIPIDSKGMRKLKNSDGIVAVLQVGGEVGTAVLVAHLETRILLKLA